MIGNIRMKELNLRELKLYKTMSIFKEVNNEYRRVTIDDVSDKEVKYRYEGESNVMSAFVVTGFKIPTCLFPDKEDEDRYAELFYDDWGMIRPGKPMNNFQIFLHNGTGHLRNPHRNPGGNQADSAESRRTSPIGRKIQENNATPTSSKLQGRAVTVCEGAPDFVV